MTERSVGGVRRALFAAVAVAAVSGACFRKPKHPVPVPEPVLLDIQNHGFPDVDVYVLPSATPGGAIRLASVSGFSKRSVHVRVSQLQPGFVLQLQVHAVGGIGSWISPAMAVGPGEHIVLEINTDATGNMNHSILYALPGMGGAEGSTAPVHP